MPLPRFHRGGKAGKTRESQKTCRNFINASGIKHHTMKHPLVPSAGTGWFRVPIRSMHNRLFLSLLNRFTAAVYHDPSRSPFSASARSVLFSLDPHQSCRTYLIGHFPPLPFQAGQRSGQGYDLFNVTGFQCHSGHDDFTIPGHSLTVIPFWQFN